MKRDMKLIREILLAIEASDSALGPGEFKIEGYAVRQPLSASMPEQLRSRIEAVGRPPA
jgi:hypothetical protein